MPHKARFFCAAVFACAVSAVIAGSEPDGSLSDRLGDVLAGDLGGQDVVEKTKSGRVKNSMPLTGQPFRVMAVLHGLDSHDKLGNAAVCLDVNGDGFCDRNDIGLTMSSKDGQAEFQIEEGAFISAVENFRNIVAVTQFGVLAARIDSGAPVASKAHLLRYDLSLPSTLVAQSASALVGTELEDYNGAVNASTEELGGDKNDLREHDFKENSPVYIFFKSLRDAKMDIDSTVFIPGALRDIRSDLAQHFSPEYISLYFQKTGEFSVRQASDNNPPENPRIIYTVDLSTCYSLQFSGRAEDQDKGDVITYRWDFGDGSDVQTTKSAEEPIFHKFSPGGKTDGQYTVRMTADDGRGGTVSVEQPVFINTALCPAEAKPYVFYAKNDSGSYDISFNLSPMTLRQEKIKGYRWDFGDGRHQETDGAVPQVSHEYKARTKPYTIVVNAYAESGKAWSASAKITPDPAKAGELPESDMGIDFNGQTIRLYQNDYGDPDALRGLNTSWKIESVTDEPVISDIFMTGEKSFVYPLPVNPDDNIAEYIVILGQSDSAGNYRSIIQGIYCDKATKECTYN